jgi:hypothetical protein
VVYHQVVQYCASDLSSFYLDVLKDRLYCDARRTRRRYLDRDAPHRRDLATLLSPVLTTADGSTLLPGLHGLRTSPLPRGRAGGGEVSRGRRSCRLREAKGPKKRP